MSENDFKSLADRYARELMSAYGLKHQPIPEAPKETPTTEVCNSNDDCKPVGINFIPEYNFAKYIDRGYLRVRAFTAPDGSPVSGVRVIVSRRQDGNPVFHRELTTDSEGGTEKLPLPTPPRSGQGIPVAACYDIVAVLDGYGTVVIRDACVFAETVSVQPIEMQRKE